MTDISQIVKPRPMDSRATRRALLITGELAVLMAAVGTATLLFAKQPTLGAGAILTAAPAFIEAAGAKSVRALAWLGVLVGLGAMMLVIR